MSRAAVRSAVSNWLAPANVAGMATMFPAAPKIAQGTAYYGPDGFNNGSGAWGFVHINKETEHPAGFGGQAPSGAYLAPKVMYYEVGVVVHFLSVRIEACTYMDDYDALIDNIKDQIRSDHRLGTAGLPEDQQIFESATTQGSLDGIEVVSDLPIVDGETAYQFSVVEFDVKQWKVITSS